MSLNRSQMTLLISGLGSVGFSALFAALSLGVKNIIAVDLVDSRLEQAKSFGASHVINARNGDPVAEVMKITQDAGVRYAIECTGAPKACRAAFLYWRSRHDGSDRGVDLAHGNRIYGVPFPHSIHCRLC